MAANAERSDIAGEIVASGRRSVSVVIPLWNERALTAACVESLATGRAVHGLPDELVLVDNGSTDDTGPWLQRLAEELPWVRPVPLPENRGFAAGCNAGLAVARGEWTVFLNNDTLAPCALLPRLLAAALREPNAGLVAPVSNYVKGRQLLELFQDERAEDVEGIQARLERDHGRRCEDVAQLTGLCLLARRELFDALGGFDERFGLGNYEDDDLCLRVRLLGHRLLVARDAYLFHHGNRTFRALGVDYAQQLREKRAQYDDKWRGEVLLELEHAIEAQDLSAARDLRRQAAARPPAWLHRADARIAEGEGDWHGAQQHWRDYLRYCPGDSEAHAHVALCTIHAGDEEGGRAQLAAVLAEHCYDSLVAASAMTQLAEHARKCGRKELAMEDVEDALRLRPAFVPAVQLRAVLLLDQGAHAEALELLEPWREHTDEAVHANRGIALYHLGRLDEALAAFERGAALGAADCASARNLAALRSALGCG